MDCTLITNMTLELEMELQKLMAEQVEISTRLDVGQGYWSKEQVERDCRALDRVKKRIAEINATEDK